MCVCVLKCLLICIHIFTKLYMLYHIVTLFTNKYVYYIYIIIYIYMYACVLVGSYGRLKNMRFHDSKGLSLSVPMFKYQELQLCHFATSASCISFQLYLARPLN